MKKFKVTLILANCPRIISDELSAENFLENIVKEANVRNKINIQVEEIYAKEVYEEEEKKFHDGAVCSFCGTTVTEDEYSKGQSDCHKKDVISEEEYVSGY